MTLRAAIPAKLRQLDWARGLRAGLAVAAAMVVCRSFNLPMGWSALGAFEGNIVDNGGPYRTRFASIALLMGVGSLGAVLASLASAHLPFVLVLTAAFAFVITYLRAAGPPFTTSSVIILVIFFVGLDHPSYALPVALHQAALFLGGCAGAAVLSLFLWPIYPFGHARRAIGECYRLLAASVVEIDHALVQPGAQPDEAAWRTQWFSVAHGFPHRMRIALETARGSLGSVRARTPARTKRGRNLAVLLETADILLSRAIVLMELGERSLREGGTHDLAEVSSRLNSLREAASLIALALREPAQLASVQRQGGALIAAMRATHLPAPASLFASAFHALDGEFSLNFETALEALTGVSTGNAQMRVESLRMQSPGQLELLQQNWTFASSTMRHALRTSAVCVASVLLVRALHLPYGEWMALTAVIVLQPYLAHTWRKSIQRVGGTIAGGLLAALLAVFVRSPEMLIFTVCITSFFTLAWFAVDYAWYCFFLTPTFVLLTVHGHHGWGVAGIRAMDTILGAALALLAVKVLWKESEHLRLGAVFARSASANAAYLAAVQRYWASPSTERGDADKAILAPARRRAGLANNESEEALERLMLEPVQGSEAAVRTEHALAFATYARRFTQGVTTTSILHPEPPGPGWILFIDSLRIRLQHIATLLAGKQAEAAQPRLTLPGEPEEAQSVRLRRQAEVLEKAAVALGNSTQVGESGRAPTVSGQWPGGKQDNAPYQER